MVIDTGFESVIQFLLIRYRFHQVEIVNLTVLFPHGDQEVQ